MNFDQLEQLAAVAEEGSASRAASRLTISQPALSRSLKRLEKELGCELFDRGPNSMELNRAGRLALEFAEEALRGKRRLADQLAALEERSRIVRIGTVAPAPLWRLSARILEAQPDALLSPEFMTEDAVERALMNRDVEFGITARPLTLPCTSCEEILEERLFAYVPRGHELAGRTSVSFAELDGNEFIMLADIGVWDALVRRAMPHASFVVQHDRSVMEQLLASTDALAFSTDASGSMRNHPGRVAVPISDDAATMRFYLVRDAC